MSSTQGNSNGSPPSIPLLSGIQNGVGLGSAENGAPQVTPPNQAGFQVPNATQIQQATETLQAAQIIPDQTAQNAALGQEQQLANTELGEMQNGPGTGGSAAEMATVTGLQNNQAAANAETQGLASAANPLQGERMAGQIQGQQNVQVAAAGAQARAGEEQQIANNAQNALSSVSQGTLSGASQRLQAQVAQQNIVQQAITDRAQLSAMQLQASMQYAQLSQQYQLQQRQDYITAQTQALKNTQLMVGAILKAAGSAAAVGVSSYNSGLSGGYEQVGTPGATAESDNAPSVETYDIPETGTGQGIGGGGAYNVP